MSKVILERIGSPTETFMDPEEYKTNLEYMKKMNESYLSKRVEIKSRLGRRIYRKSS